METLESIDKIERVKAETAQLRQKVAQAPDNMRKATESLNALSDVDNDDEPVKRSRPCRCASLSYASPNSLTICKPLSPTLRPTIASLFRCKPSRSVCKIRCTPRLSSYSKFVTV